jgi:hypothetical protein
VRLGASYYFCIELVIFALISHYRVLIAGALPITYQRAHRTVGSRAIALCMGRDSVLPKRVLGSLNRPGTPVFNIIFSQDASQCL